MELILSNTNGVPTMSSLEMVEYINASRGNKGAVLQHKDFLEKVIKVLGKAAAEFSATAFYTVNNAKRERTIYNFPKREAMLMAMSYSYDLQAQVYDAWEAAEKSLSNSSVIALPNFEDPVEAAMAWAEQYKISRDVKQQLTIVAPLADAFKQISEDEETMMNLADCAKVLDMKPRKFNSWLRQNNYLQHNNVAYQSKITQGLFVLKYSCAKPKDGVEYKPTTLVTSKGVTYFQNKFKGE